MYLRPSLRANARERKEGLQIFSGGKEAFAVENTLGEVLPQLCKQFADLHLFVPINILYVSSINAFERCST